MATAQEIFVQKMRRLESIEQQYYSDKVSEDDNSYLCHGLRIWQLEKLESIFQKKLLLAARYVPKTFDSIDGKTHPLLVDAEDEDNTNKGGYVSFVPSKGKINTLNQFVFRNLFLAFNKNIPARETFYVYYEEHKALRRLGINTRNLYSYVEDEYLVESGVSLNDLAFIGIDSNRYNNHENDLFELIKAVIDLMKAYEIGVPFIDISTGYTIFEGVKKQKEIK